MMPIRVTVGPLATASANNIALSQTPSAAGAITLNGSTVVAGVAILDMPRNILLTVSASETTKTFTITGTNWAGDKISEVLTGVASGTATSVLDYKTVTSIVVSAATAGAITFGTTTTAGSQWARLDGWGNYAVAIQCTISGTINYTLQQTLDDPNDPVNPVTPANMTWVASSAITGASTNQQSNYGLFTPVWARILLNSGTGSVVTTFVQSGVVNR